MGKRTFSREFKLEAVRLVRDRGVAKSQAAGVGDSFERFAQMNQGLRS
jgi:transposase-like protein